MGQLTCSNGIILVVILILSSVIVHALPIHVLNSMTSSLRPHLVKSPACMKISPSGMSNLMCGVNECVSLIHTTRTLLLGISELGGFIVIFITRCVCLASKSRHAAVGSCVNSCTTIDICSRFFSASKIVWIGSIASRCHLIHLFLFRRQTNTFHLFVLTFVYSTEQTMQGVCSRWHFNRDVKL